MKGLFARVFWLFWPAMMLVTVGFVVIAAATFPSERVERRTRRVTDSVELHAGRAARAFLAGDQGGAAAALDQTDDGDHDMAVGLYRAGKLVAQARSAPAPRSELGTLTPLVTAPRVVPGDDADVVVVALDTPGFVAVADIPHWSILSRPPRAVTVVWQMTLIVLVSAAVAYLLARRFARPIEALRRAAARIAAGDLDARVTPAIGRFSSETVALGQDFDHMAERLAGLIESQKRLLRDVSHELRSPLARLEVALELARQRAGDAAGPMLDRIARDVERLGALISEVLALSRLDAEDSAERAVVDLQALTTEVASDADFEAQSRGRAVLLRATTEVTILGRPEPLRRAIENVIRNAMQFTAPETAVEVQLTRCPQGALIVVRDHGPGVPEGALPHLFEPFYRVAEDRDRNTGGVGLGLAIVDRAVRQHGGQVTARNAEGGGLEVTLLLPARVAA